LSKTNCINYQPKGKGYSDGIGAGEVVGGKVCLS